VLDPEIGATRALEVFHAQHPGARLRVYHLTYGESAEEQRFLSEVPAPPPSFLPFPLPHSLP